MLSRTLRPGEFPTFVTSAAGVLRLVLLIASGLGAEAASAHGGAFRGPSLPPPAATTPGAGAAAKGGPSSSGGGLWRNSDPASWSQWWALDRDWYLRRGEFLYDPGSAAGQLQGAAPLVPGVRGWEAVLRQQAVPELIRILRKEKDVDMLTAAVMTLAKLGLDPADDEDGQPAEISTRAAIESLLDHGNQEVAESAVLALGVLGQADVAPQLADLLHGKGKGRRKVDRRTRAFAAYGLGVIGRRLTAGAVRQYCVHHLVERLKDLDGASPDVGVACVISIGLIRLQASGNLPQAEGPAPRPSTSREGQVLFLWSLLQERAVEDEVLAYVPTALARLADDVVELRDLLIPDLVARLAPRSKEAPEVRVGCVHALGLLVTADQAALDAAARTRLLELARDGDRLERVLALAALGRIGGRTAGGQVGDVPRQLRSFLMERLSKGQSYETPWAALGVGLLENGRRAAGGNAALGTLAALRHALGEAANPDEVGSLCIALALAGDREAIPLIHKRAEEGDETARGHAVTALGLLRAASAQALLRSMASDGRRPALAREAAIALSLLGDRQYQVSLVSEAQGERFIGHQISALLSLAYLGDASSVVPLIGILKGRRQAETAQAYAAVALGIIADKDLIPWNHPIATNVGWWKAPETLLDPSTGRGVLDLF